MRVDNAFNNVLDVMARDFQDSPATLSTVTTAKKLLAEYQEDGYAAAHAIAYIAIAMGLLPVEELFAGAASVSHWVEEVRKQAAA